jgi:class 3 adenylate cyclase
MNRLTRGLGLTDGRAGDRSGGPPDAVATPARRRLAAILAVDVVGYSRLMGADEEGTLNRLKAHRRERQLRHRTFFHRELSQKFNARLTATDLHKN